MQEKNCGQARPCFPIREDRDFQGPVPAHGHVQGIIQKREIQLSFRDYRVDKDLQLRMQKMKSVHNKLMLSTFAILKIVRLT